VEEDEDEMEAKRGSRIVVESERVGAAEREGEVLEVIHGDVGVRYRVRWSDGRETMFTPAGGSVRLAGGAAKSSSGAKAAASPSKRRATPKATKSSKRPASKS
jgi:hypothetical protein